jgi:uncharacterized protein YcbK (DUF882 family)
MNYFKRSEFLCKCGDCGFDTVDFETLHLCNEIRDFEGAPVVVTSGCRCAAHNAKIHGAMSSQHLLGRAADLAVSQPELTYKWLCRQYPNKYGFGLYDKKGFVHVDTRTNGPARWDARNK